MNRNIGVTQTKANPSVRYGALHHLVRGILANKLLLLEIQGTTVERDRDKGKKALSAPCDGGA